MLDCNAQPSPKIKLSKWSNQWFDIKTTLQRNLIKLHDPVLRNLLLNRSCSTFYHSIQLPNDSPSISFTVLSNVTLFICSKQVQLSNEIMEYFVGYRNYSSCEGVDIYYRNTNSSFLSTAHGSPPNDCLVTYLPMISNENSIPIDHELFQLLAADFDLEWQLAVECSICHLSEGQCQADKNRNFLCAEPQNGTSRKLMVKVIGAAIVGVLVVIVVLLGLFLCSARKLPHGNSMNETDGCQNIEAILQNYGSLAPKRYYYSDVKEMTDFFRIKLGQGGYGYVYKGKLRDGSPVAIKVLKESKGDGEEFINEVASISRTSHVNIVSLLGFCFQGQKKALIYEFMSNGSLEKFIYGKKVNGQLEWQTLYKISIGIARGLEYLHRGCKTRIVHFDIKPHNILLDEDFCPKISDFGLAKLCTKKESIFSLLGARGTIGYIAPEVVCKNIGGVSHKSDVYSYGMMVLEMVGGRKNVDVGVDHESEIYFPHWIYSKLRCGKELGLSGISNEEDNEQARKMLIVSLWCIQTDPSNRPSMTDVVDMLEGTLEELQIPPKPYLYASKVPSTRSTIPIP